MGHPVKAFSLSLMYDVNTIFNYIYKQFYYFNEFMCSRQRCLLKT